MLAKLFNNISVQSLIRAGIAAYAWLILAVIISPTLDGSFQILNYEIAVGGSLIKLIIVLFVPVICWWLNHRVNAIGLLKHDYQLLAIMPLLLAPLLMEFTNLAALFALAMAVVLLVRLFELVSTIDPKYILFDSGVLVALMALIVPEASFFLILIWLASLNFGQLNFKTLLIPILAILGTYFMFFTVLYWLFDYNIADYLIHHFSQISFGFKGFAFDIALVPVIIIGFPAAAETIQVYGKANVKKRQLFTFLIFFLILSLLAIVFIQGSVLNQIWPFMPMAIFIVNLVHYLRKQWLKDMVYILLLVSLLLSVFL